MKEILACRRDLLYAIQTYGTLIDKRTRTIKPRLYPAQLLLHNTLENDPWVMILKARQLGSTSYVALRFFFKTLLNKNFRCAVVAHTREAAEQIWKIYKTIYDHLPEWLRVESSSDNARELAFAHGGYLRVGSAGSMSWRGSTFNAIHASEVAFWENTEESVRALFQAASDGSEVILETTANGLNAFNRIWYGSDGFTRLFFSWTMDPLYLNTRVPRTLTEPEQAYITEHELEPDRANWFVQTLRTKCLGSMDTFNQEYPITPELAFLASGGPFFTVRYPPEESNHHPKLKSTGWVIYEKPKEFRSYILGADPASGSQSKGASYSACVVIDITDRECMTVVATFQQKLPTWQFAKQILEKAEEYHALVVGEVWRGGPGEEANGQAVLDYLLDAEYPYLYRRLSRERIGGQMQQLFGFATTSKTRPLMLGRAHEAIDMGHLDPVCCRLKSEMNSFRYNESGRPMASEGENDDLVMSMSLAIMGLDQANFYQDEIQRRRRPRTNREWLEYEAQTGKLGDEIADDEFLDSPWDAIIDEPPLGRARRWVQPT